MTIMRLCSYGELHPAGKRCPRYRKPSGRRGSTRRWRKLRTAILTRDHLACRRCGLATNLEVHHIDGDFRNDDPANLLTLCGRCHDEAEVERGVCHQNSGADTRAQILRKRETPNAGSETATLKNKSVPVRGLLNLDATEATIDRKLPQGGGAHQAWSLVHLGRPWRGGSSRCLGCPGCASLLRW
jgi:hypothetical protein